MGKTRDYFRKTGGTKGTFHSRLGRVKERNDESNRSRIYRTIKKKVLMTWITSSRARHPGVEVKWALGSITKNKAR